MARRKDKRDVRKNGGKNDSGGEKRKRLVGWRVHGKKENVRRALRGQRGGEERGKIIRKKEENIKNYARRRKERRIRDGKKRHRKQRRRGKCGGLLMEKKEIEGNRQWDKNRRMERTF